MACFIGLMSGTSLDGIDGVLATQNPGSKLLHCRAHVHHSLPPVLRAELLALNSSGSDELHRAAVAANSLMDCYADVVAELLRQGGVRPAEVIALGAHGQTVRHQPSSLLHSGYTLQLINGARLAELSHIDVICDFRSRDVAAGGEGAPLVPAFHAAQFARPGHSRAVLNVGGIANLTLLGSDGSVRGFDTGPGNVLMDLWCLRERGLPYDAEGRWAASGRCVEPLLQTMLADPYFHRAPPKSTGRDLFDAAWLRVALSADKSPAVDVMATLTELTARSITNDLMRYEPDVEELIVCGGGAYNAHLLDRLASGLKSGAVVTSSANHGLPPDQVEAMAFAWLASAFLDRRPGNLPAVTGARGARILGALYPAG